MRRGHQIAAVAITALALVILVMYGIVLAADRVPNPHNPMGLTNKLLGMLGMLIAFAGSLLAYIYRQGIKGLEIAITQQSALIGTQIIAAVSPIDARVTNNENDTSAAFREINSIKKDFMSNASHAAICEKASKP